MQFAVKSPNKYESADTSIKYLKIKILDVFFNSQVCSLVYIRDITKLIEIKRNGMEKNAQLEGKLLLNNPNKFLTNVMEILLSQFDNILNLEL